MVEENSLNNKYYRIKPDYILTYMQRFTQTLDLKCMRNQHFDKKYLKGWIVSTG